MIRVIKLRLKLSDFIDTDLEKIIMERIKAIENDLEIRIILYFWLGDENIDLKSFYERWKENLSIKTIIKNDSSLKANELIYFDIAPHDIEYNSNIRFQSKYKFIEQIPTLLNGFHQITKFTTAEKNKKPQKRNDYAD
tara:strand:+ start:836 stop:1249 length:414 start_codon:yes stop_codon:yes gene_type:complete